jgi:hypothetical protein
MNLSDRGLGQRLRLSINEGVFRFSQFFLEEGLDLGDGFDNNGQIELLEGCCVAHSLSFSPVEQDLPQSQRCIMYLLHLLIVGCAR